MALASARSGEMHDGLPAFTLPGLPSVDVWEEMLPLARADWQRLAAHPLSSAGLARIAAGQQAWLDAAQGQLARVGGSAAG